MNRAERRRLEKNKAKDIDCLQKFLPGLSRQQVERRVDFTYSRLLQMYNEDITKIKDQLADICTTELLEAEQYMMVGVVMIALKSLEMTFGDLKTVQHGMNRFLRNFNRALECVDETGIMETYRQMQDKYDLGDLGFEDHDYDLNNILNLWNNKEEKISEYIWQVWNRRVKEIEELGDNVRKIM